MALQVQEILDKLTGTTETDWDVEIEGQHYIRRFCPDERLIILGGGNIGQMIARYAKSAGFHVVAVDDRPSFANRSCFPDADEIYCDTFVHAIEILRITARDYITVVTRGHRYDLDCLHAVLQGDFPHYLGMMGSGRRVAATRTLLQQEGVEQSLIGRIHMPIGLPIGAMTPQEIGISIVAELIASRRIRLEKYSDSPERNCMEHSDIDRKFAEFLKKDRQPKALLLVYETSGSTPVKSGAMMVLAQSGQTAGTIGGGCTEAAALREALRLIGTGKERCMLLDMTNDMAAQKGMVCGGTMYVWMTDLILDGDEI